MGRSLLNALNNLEVVDQYTEAIQELGYKLETLVRGEGARGGLLACWAACRLLGCLPAGLHVGVWLRLGGVSACRQVACSGSSRSAAAAVHPPAFATRLPPYAGGEGA